MKLPAMVYSDNIITKKQDAFGGYNHNLYAGDGEIYDMENLTSRYYPLLSPRPARRLYKTLAKPNGIFGRDKLVYVDGTSFYYDGAVKGTVADSVKTFAALGVYIIILPDKKYYNTYTDVFGGLESTYTGAATFQDGTLYDEAAEANTIYHSGVTWSDYFNVGDAVTISYCDTLTENNKTAIIREISGAYLRFYENAFENGSESYVIIARTVPDMDYICENENRLWGCAGDTIYCSKLGDIFNWNVFDGLDTDSFAVNVGSAGDFTGCISYLGYPVFFKANNIYKAYGSVPSNFQIMGSATLGIADGSGSSAAIAGEALFYLSRAGIQAYSGGMPSSIGAVFGTERYKNAVGGSDGLKYYVSMKDSTEGWHLFVYDTQRGLWHREDDTQVLSFAFTDNLYFLDTSGNIWIGGNIIDPPVGTTEEASVAWEVEFGDFVESEPNKKGVSKLLIRTELDTGATLTVQMLFDNDSAWTTVQSLTASAKRSYNLPIIPRRADHYRIKLSGTGGCRIYSIAREYYAGSEN